ncbi:MAG TPA: outer membrane lipoprotein carrier protein LolA, partial [Alphaproteobacteria bacterium]|nr:outer membrane lipoprotein carrier protein LolA [Alphaproteobacteria bacterium]
MIFSVRKVLLFALPLVCMLGAAAQIPAHSQNDALAGLNAQQRADLDRVNSYLNRLDRLSAGFMQIAPDGDVSRGQFFLNRPGRMRFEYAPPDDMLIVADGTSVAVREGADAMIDRYPLGSTPLSPILAE